MRTQLLIILLYLISPLLSHGTNEPFPGKRGVFHGFSSYDFKMDKVSCRVVTPKKIAQGRPWIWRARFWGHEPQTDLALLKLGWHVGYCDVGNLFGSPKAIKRWNAFYDYLISKHGFSKKPALEGMSRGGLIIYNWAAANPKRVACIYGDAPVCDFKSWPAGKGKAKPSTRAWKSCLAAYGLTEQEALRFKGNPIDQLKPIAQAKIPILHVVGDADKVVPVIENTAIVEKRYRELGGSIQVIHKPGVGHHPHSLKNAKPIVDFILKNTSNR